MRPFSRILLVQALAAAVVGQEATPAPPTFARDVAPIVYRACSGCHRPGQPAPFSLLGFDDVWKRRAQIVDVTQQRLMPPWLPTQGEFVDDRRLSAAAIATLQRGSAGRTRRARRCSGRQRCGRAMPRWLQRSRRSIGDAHPGPRGIDRRHEVDKALVREGRQELHARMLSRRASAAMGSFAVTGIGLFAACAGTPAARERAPNIVVILVDDLGWRDVGAYGQEVASTPHIDRLAREGMLFTQAYAANPVCSPTRAALMTGKYPARLDINDWIPGTPFPQARMRAPVDRDELPLAQATLAEVLRARGYATWHVGKWHLGGAGFLPQDQGFDVNWMGGHIGHPASHFFPFGWGADGKPAHTHAVPALPPGSALGDYLADVQANTAAAAIRAARGSEQPFFLHLAFYAVHAPIEAKPLDVERQRQARQARMAQRSAAAREPAPDELPRPAFAAMLENLDAAVGTVLAALDEAGLADDTVVVFTSDNGGLDSVSNNRPLRGGKRSLWEGGIRVPLLVRWPGVVAAGARSELPVITQDVHRGLRAAAGADVDAEVAADAFDLLPVWRGDGPGMRPPLFWHFPQHETFAVGPRGAMRDGDWKLIEDFATGAAMLFDLAHDPNETNDLAAAEPQRAAAMLAALRAWRQQVGAAMPTPNPDYVPKRG